MIVNRNAINTSVLHSTLQEEVTRLRKMCSESNLLTLQRTLLSTQQNYQSLQRNYTTRNNQKQQKRSYQLQVTKELIENRKQQDTHLSETVQLNWQLLSQLQKIRAEIRAKQSQNNAEENKGLQLSRDYLKREQRIKSIELKSQDILEAIKKSLLTATLFRQQKSKLQGEIKSNLNELQIQKRLRIIIRSDIGSLHQEIGILRKQKIQAAQQATQEKFNFIKLDHTYGLQRSALEKQKQQKTVAATEYQQRLEQRTNCEQQLFNDVETLEETAAKIETQIVKNLNTTQAIQSSIFQTRVARTSAKTTQTAIRNKITRLKELKQALISIVANC